MSEAKPKSEASVDLAAMVAGLEAALDDAIRRAEAGQAVDLAGFDAQVAEACAAAEQADRDAAKALAGRFQGVLDRFERLADLLRAPDGS